MNFKWRYIFFIITSMTIGAGMLYSFTFTYKSQFDKIGGKNILSKSKVDFNSSVFKVAIDTVKEPEKEYFKGFKAKINPIDTSFIIENKQFCEHKSGHPYLIAVVPSAPGDRMVRDVIRNTFGSYGFGANADKLLNAHNITMKMLFVLGSGSNEDERMRVIEEHAVYGDIIQAHFTDSYRNLTKKMLISLKWIVSYCANVDFVVKVDTDVFVNVPLLIQRLKSERNGTFIGHVYQDGHVRRNGKWKVTEDEYPLNKYPPYMSGNAYVISGNLVSGLVHAAEHLPYMPIEDAFITGCLSKITSARLVNVSGFSKWLDPKPEPCGFFKESKITGTKVTPELMYQLWDAQNHFHNKCKR